MLQLYKYPRTYHLPNSLGYTSDDKVLKTTDIFIDKDVVITEKMDGENTTMYNDYIHARSLDSNNHPSRNYVKGLWGNIKHEIPSGWRICGENLYAQHSIIYNNLNAYFLVFSIFDEYNNCLSWEETKEYCNLLGLQTVNELYVGKFDSVILNKIIKNLNLTIQEGLVVRNANKFSYCEFGDNVAKWVRENHVQTDNHWTEAPIIPNKLQHDK